MSLRSLLTSARILLDTHGRDLALLALRVGFGLFMIVNHGWPKLMKWAEKHETFSDPLGVSPPVSMALTIFGELVCSAFLLGGLFTRAAAVPAAVTMLVAALIVHKDAPLKDGEHALLFAVAWLALFFTGAGRWSLDAVLARRRG